MVPKERAKAVGSQPTGPGEDQVGGAHGDENGATGTAPVSMAAGGPGSPPGARKGHMEMRPDQGLLKESQGVPCGGVGVLPRPGPAPRPPSRIDDGRHAPPPPLGPGGGPRRDDAGGAEGRGGGVAARAVEEDGDPSAGSDPGMMP